MKMYVECARNYAFSRSEMKTIRNKYISLCVFFSRIYIVVYIVQQHKHTYNNNIVCNAYKRMKRSHKCSEKYYMTNIIILK